MNNDILLAIAKIGIDGGFLKQKYILDLFTFIAEDEYEDDFIKIKDSSYYLKTEEEDLLITNKYKDTFLTFTTKIIIPKDFLPNVKNQIETTIGRLIMNYILLSNNFKYKVPYINQPFNIGYIEKNYIVNLLSDDPNELDKIQMDEYIKFMDSVIYIEGFSKFLSVAATEKTLLPPDGIQEYKAKVLKEIKAKYNIKDKITDPKIMAEVEEKLKAYEDKWLEGDVSKGRLMHGKTEIARKKMFLDVGVTNTFNGKDDAVERSLSDSWGTDPETLATLFNDARSGSYYRGAETQNGGVAAKVLLRASADIDIKDEDCGSKMGIEIAISKNHVGRYILEGGKPLLLTNENIGKYENKVKVLRTPMFCKLGKNFCTTCSGIPMKDYEKGVSLLSIETGGGILKLSLKKFHVSELSLANVSIDDIL